MLKMICAWKSIVPKIHTREKNEAQFMPYLCLKYNGFYQNAVNICVYKYDSMYFQANARHKHGINCGHNFFSWAYGSIGI